MKNLGGNIKSLRNFMRKDAGVSGDGQRIEQLGWVWFLKILDASDRELELLKDDVVSVVPEPLRWASGAADKEGMTGDALQKFIDQDLFPTLRNLDLSTGNQRARIVREIFEGT
ncbi:MAG: SAM-dependent DNA methyltransferase, partial [Pseudanabaena sp.]